MNERDTDDRLERTIRRLRVQNRRYRELIQNLSSAVDILRRHREEAPALEAFESFVRNGADPAVAGAGNPDLDTDADRVAPSPRFERLESLRPLQPIPGWKCLAVEQLQMRIGFTLFGMGADEIEEAVRVVEQRQVRSRDFIPVFVVDSPVFAPFRSRGYVVEYVPRTVSVGVAGQRLDLMVRKWGLGEWVDLGQARVSTRG